jgi:esterase/lipase superfamily enzyme
LGTEYPKTPGCDYVCPNRISISAATGTSCATDRIRDYYKKVLFTTDRGINQKPNTVEIANFQNDGGKLTFGVCEVAVEKQGGVAGSLIRMINDRDSDRYYSIQNISLRKDNDWWSEVGTELKGVRNGDALLFIHGFNTSFADACRRAAQIAYDLKFAGPIFLYSWPSRNRLLWYGMDEDSAKWTTDHFVSFMKEILDLKDLGHLHIIAHSMGNRILSDGLLSSNITKKERTKLGQIVFAAADVNRKTFHEQYELEKIKAMRVTLYASNHDQALLASKIFHGFVRLGEVRPDIEIKFGMDSIDASSVDTSLLGHAYIGESRSVLDDLGALINANQSPD